VGVSPQPPQDGRWAIFVPASYKNMTSGEAELTEREVRGEYGKYRAGQRERKSLPCNALSLPAKRIKPWI
jgi:hypothetical protein